MADKAHVATDNELAKMERHLKGIYTRANKEVGEKWKQYLENAGKEIKPLQDAYEAAKKSGDPDAIKKTGKALAAKKRSMTLTDKHYRAMTEQLAQELSHVNETALAYINGQLPQIYSLNYNAVGGEIGKSVTGYSFELVDASTVKRLATSDKTLLPYKTINGKKDVRWNTKKINAEILQGILQGESMPKMAKRLTKVTEMNKASAIRNARTMVTGAENSGRMDMLHRAKAMGIEVRKVWMAAHDSRVRDAHRDLDGQEQEIDDPFDSDLGDIMYPGDPDAKPGNVYNCRCTLVYNVLGFANQHTGEVDSADNDLFSVSPATGISDANLYGTQAIGKIYDEHTSANGLKRTGFVEANELSQIVGVDYTNLSVEAANIFNQQIVRLANEYDTPLQKVRTMTKQESALSQSIFAKVSHNYSVDSAEMVINPVKCKDVSALTARIKELEAKGYCVKVMPGREAEYVVTHEFAHTIIDTNSSLKQNWVNADLKKVKSARSEIESVYKDYIAEVGKIEQDFRQAEFDFIMGSGTRKNALSLKGRLDEIKLSNYSMANADEFLAESFTNQKIGVASNQYAEKVVSVLDKYFGR